MTHNPWIKLWREKILASPRWKRVDMYQAGTYMQIILRVDDSGALRTGTLAWKVSDLAYDLSLDKRRTKRLQAAVDKLVRLDLCFVDPKDGAICISRHCELQQRGKAKK